MERTRRGGDRIIGGQSGRMMSSLCVRQMIMLIADEGDEISVQHRLFLSLPFWC